MLFSLNYQLGKSSFEKHTSPVFLFRCLASLLSQFPWWSWECWWGGSVTLCSSTSLSCWLWSEWPSSCTRTRRPLHWTLTTQWGPENSSWWVDKVVSVKAAQSDSFYLKIMLCIINYAYCNSFTSQICFNKPQFLFELSSHMFTYCTLNRCSWTGRPDVV